MPEVTILAALGFGFLLGVQHSLDADHVVVVTSIVSRSNSLLRSALMGLSWSIGHTIVLFIVGFGVLVFKLAIPDRLALSIEFLVGVILVLLGVPLIWRLVMNRNHVHLHQHGDKKHLHNHSHDEALAHDHRHIGKPLLVGMVQGLAGSGALVPLVLSTMPSVTQGLFFLLFFGLGSILSMLLFSGLISLSFRLASGFSFRLSLWVQGAAGLISVTLGLFIMWQTGFIAGLFLSIT